MLSLSDRAAVLSGEVQVRRLTGANKITAQDLRGVVV